MTLDTLQAEAPTAVQARVCVALGRDVRAVADFLRAPSARAVGDNIPLFVVGREDAELELQFQAADGRRETPEDLRQKPLEEWD